jgi:2,4-dienoyl-CoA reductase-like NADH-dependent reductase (Old Yellow Enzyme family)
VGLIVTGHTFVHPNGRAGMNQLGMHTDDHAAAWEGLLATIRAETQAAVFMQLTYAGRQGYSGGLSIRRNDKRERFPPPGTPVGEYFERQMGQVVRAFADAARRAARAGFDGVQIHMAHGFLLSECLSGHTNRRDDAWGGRDPADRRRLPLEVVDAVRAAVGKELALAVKLNGSDYLPPDGVEPAEAAETARQLAERGVQMIEVSAGMAESGLVAAQEVRGPDEEAYLLPAAREVAQRVDCAVASVGGYRSAPTMLRALGEGMDLVSLSRPLVREPDLPRLIQRDPSHPARCVSCNECFGIPRGALRCMLDHPEPLE